MNPEKQIKKYKEKLEKQNEQRLQEAVEDIQRRFTKGIDDRIRQIVRDEMGKS